jgi:hypothetical protein
VLNTNIASMAFARCRWMRSPAEAVGSLEAPIISSGYEEFYVFAILMTYL